MGALHKQPDALYQEIGFRSSIMKTILLTFILLVSSGAAHAAKGARIPLFFQTGDELYEIEGAPEFEDGSFGRIPVPAFCIVFRRYLDVGLQDYVTSSWKSLGLNKFPKRNYVSIKEATRASDRKRSLWNQYGFITFLVLGGIGGAFGAGGKQE